MIYDNIIKYDKKHVNLQNYLLYLFIKKISYYEEGIINIILEILEVQNYYNLKYALNVINNFGVYKHNNTHKLYSPLKIRFIDFINKTKLKICEIGSLNKIENNITSIYYRPINNLISKYRFFNQNLYLVMENCGEIWFLFYINTIYQKYFLILNQNIRYCYFDIMKNYDENLIPTLSIIHPILKNYYMYDFNSLNYTNQELSYNKKEVSIIKKIINDTRFYYNLEK